MELEFLSSAEYYNLMLYQHKYQIVAKDPELDSILIGIAENGRVFSLDTEESEEKAAVYLASGLGVFRKEIEIFQNWNYPENPTEQELKKSAGQFRQQILCLDENAFSDDESYWSVIAEEMEYGI